MSSECFVEAESVVYGVSCDGGNSSLRVGSVVE